MAFKSACTVLSLCAECDSRPLAGRGGGRFSSLLSLDGERVEVTPELYAKRPPSNPKEWHAVGDTPDTRMPNIKPPVLTVPAPIAPCSEAVSVNRRGASCGSLGRTFASRLQR